MNNTPVVAIVMGSASDKDVMAEAGKALSELGIPFEAHVMSAHRTPGRVHEYVSAAYKNGIRVFIAGAGKSAHLAGVVASLTCLPVIGVPMQTSDLGGLDSLLSTVQMPPGIPVGTTAIGKAGARNAGLLAVSILAAGNEELYKKLLQFRAEMAEKINEDDKKLQQENWIVAQ
ncbi:MAG: 5-(carboxyamino)imidazole ribonucleotide mutase [Deltaproteobacteria bacterium]|nr:5-(carboxyamino)imidazole ribonucleotide mutase [Deltaproteobacteria bacterium]MBN2672197.1 5-(carboxyamino)imidazole ribonucleotide mutase [Deltaproteobacteria bacterium]